MKTIAASKQTIILFSLILVKFALQYLLINPVYDLHRDEYLHLDQARHLAWGFESVPPLTSGVAWLILQLGNSMFWVKFFPALFGALTIVVVWKAAEVLGGNLFAKILAGTAVLFSAILRLNTLFQPNSFDILCWTFLYFCYIKYISTSNNKWLLAAGISFAIGFLNKYNVAFLVIGLLPAILLTEQRLVFRKRYLLTVISISLVIIAPNIYWQYEQGFPVVHHLKTLSETQLVNVNRADFLKEQLLFFFGSLFIIIAALVAFIFYPPFKKYRVFGLAFIFTLLVFVYLKAKGYYAIGLYPIYLAFGAVYLENILNSGWKLWLRPVAVVFIIALFIPMIKIAFPVFTPEKTLAYTDVLEKTGQLRWEDGKQHMLPQDYADMLGWSELAAKTDSIYAGLADQKNTLVLCDNYGQAGAINYYSKYKNIHAVSMNADYINWFPLDEMQIKNVILVKDLTDEDPEREVEKPLFKTVSVAGKIENKYARELGTTIFLLKDANTSINKLLGQEIVRTKLRDKY